MILLHFPHSNKRETTGPWGMGEPFVPAPPHFAVLEFVSLVFIVFPCLHDPIGADAPRPCILATHAIHISCWTSRRASLSFDCNVHKLSRFCLNFTAINLHIVWGASSIQRVIELCLDVRLFIYINEELRHNILQDDGKDESVQLVSNLRYCQTRKEREAIKWL